MERPQDIHLPFFAYGVFRPGQLAFFKLRDLVDAIQDPTRVSGRLLLRDGLPIIDSTITTEKVQGALLTFRPRRAAEAYDRIVAMEPDNQYRWHEARVAGTSANVLVGRSPKKGSVPCEDAEWSGWADPLFNEALDVVEETLNSRDMDENLRSVFKLQMAYLLLWSSIERYVSLRYHLGANATDKIKKLAKESAFAENLRRYSTGPRYIFRTDRPADRETLDPDSPGKAVDYYYQVRSNIAHRGKGVFQDYAVLRNSLLELLPIFRGVLKAAELDAAADPSP
jgi:hypothetical protein